MVSEFYEAGFFSFQDLYDNGEKDLICATDQPAVSTSIRINNDSKSVFDYQGYVVPNQLRELEDRIDQVTNSSQWIESFSQNSLDREFDWSSYHLNT